MPLSVKVVLSSGRATKDELVIVGRAPSPVAMVPEPPNAIVSPLTVRDELTNLALAIVVLAILAFV